MAKKKRERATNHADFAGADAHAEAVDKLADAGAKENEKRGKNAGPISDEAMLRHIELIQGAELEYDEARDAAAVKSGILRNRYKVAKNDGVDIEALKLALRLAKRSSGEVVTEHRAVRRIILLMNLPIGHQFDLFKVAGDDEPETAPTDEKTLEAEATLAGEHAGLNGEPRENNPHPAGTPKWFGWNNGHQVGTDKLADGLRTGNAHAATGAPAH